MESTSYGIGYFVGALCGFVVSLLVVYFISRKFLGKCQYDERQELIRGRAYKYAFFTLFIGGFFFTIFSMLCAQISLGVIMSILLFASVAVYAIYCIMNDAYFGLDDKKKKNFIILDIVCCLINVFGSVSFFTGGIDFSQGLPDGFLNLLCVLCFGVIGIAIAVKTMLEKRGAANEES